MINTDIVIIGGGAAGLMCACLIDGEKHSVTIIERNNRVGRKLMITGKGRCNLTNMCDNDTLHSSVTKNGKFLYSAFSAFSPQDTCDFFRSMNVELKTERGNRVFPKSDKASDIVDALKRKAIANNVKLINGKAVRVNTENGAVVSVLLDNASEIFCKHCVLATGGASYPLTGSDGSGYTLARGLGHSIVPLSPSLVPVNVFEQYAVDMQGLSLKNVGVTVEDTRNGKKVFSALGELMFTHFGLSGPLILSASAHMRNMEKERWKIYIDLKPALDLHKLDERILRDFREYSNRDFANSLDKLLPKKMIPVIIKLSGIPADKKVNQITAERRAGLCTLLKRLPFTVTGFRPIEEAVITSGGVDTKEINPKTMKSKLINNLYFAGEIIDVDAYTGGFNLQIAFSTANAVARAFD